MALNAVVRAVTQLAEEQKLDLRSQREKEHL